MIGPLMQKTADTWAGLSALSKWITKITGIVIGITGAAVGLAKAWDTYDLPKIASQHWVIAQEAPRDKKVEQIFQYQKVDRIERLQSEKESLDQKILDWQVKLNGVTDIIIRQLLEDGLRDLVHKRTVLVEKIKEIKSEE